MMRRTLPLVATFAFVAACGDTDQAQQGRAAAEAASTQTADAGIPTKPQIVAPPESELDPPDYQYTWTGSCAFIDVVAVPTAMGQNLTFLEDGTVVDEDGNEVPKVRSYSLPYLTIYNGQGGVLRHGPGFNSESVAQWLTLYEDKPVPIEGPAINTLTAHTTPVKDAPPLTDALLAANITFVKYSADWCAPCKMQAAAIKSFRAAVPDADVVHIDIEADAQKWGAAGDNLDSCDVN